ncbi:TetR/AcrR family transcriptional regulator [Haliangium sp.]|uniref:TetR/AcrR family transcriptional regulator n=1 Tax=Haliangium sp. TaxID=2663208 RepID=UPI003D0A52B1
MPRVSEEIKQMTRARLLRAAADAFARDGLAGANINHISVEAGFAKGTVYNYFESKEALFLAVIEEACVRTLEQAPLPTEAGARAQIEALLALDVAWAKANEPFAKVLVREGLAADEALYPKILAATEPLLRPVVEALTAGAARGEVRRDMPAEQLALIVIGLHEMALVQHWGSGGAWPALDDIPALVTRIFFEGAQPTPSEPGDRP